MVIANKRNDFFVTVDRIFTKYFLNEICPAPAILARRVAWHFQIRVKSSTWIYRPAKGWKQLSQYHLALGEVVLLSGVTLSKTHLLSDVHLVLARSEIRSAPALSRLCLVMAVATLLLTVQGQQVVSAAKRR